MESGTLWAIVILLFLLSMIPILKIRGSLTTIARVKSGEQQIKVEAEQRKVFLKESIDVLAKSIIDEQVEYSEACMRIKILIDHWDSTLHSDERFGVFNRVYEKLENHPRFGARKQIDKRFLRKLDEERHRIELAFKDDIKTAAKALVTLLAA
jgi:hypothetical protein